MELRWETHKFWVECIEQRYTKTTPERAYLECRDMIASGYSHGIIDMAEVKRLLEVNSMIVRSKGIEPWEVLNG